MPLLFQPVMGQDGVMAAGVTPNARTTQGTTPSGAYYAPPPQFNDAALQYADAQEAYKRALARYNQQRGDLLRQYGYLGDIDPETGTVKNLRVDTGNAYGLLQRTLHNAALEDESAVNAMNDRGIFGGLAHQAESELKYQHAGQTADLASALQGSLGDIDAQQLDAKQALDQALYEMQREAALNAILAQEFNPANVGDDNSGGGASNPRANTVAAIAARNIANAVKNTKKITKLHPGVTVQKKRGVISMH